MLKVPTRMGCNVCPNAQKGKMANCPFPSSREQPTRHFTMHPKGQLLSPCILSWNPTLRRKSCSPLLGEGLRLRSCLVAGWAAHHSHWGTIIPNIEEVRNHEAVVYHSGLWQFHEALAQKPLSLWKEIAFGVWMLVGNNENVLRHQMSGLILARTSILPAPF